MCVCVCVCVFCYHTSCYIPCLYVEIKIPLSFLCHFLHMHCVDFVENALFKSYGNICWPPLPSSLLDRLSIDKMDSNGFFSRWLVCRTSDMSYNLTGWSLVTVNCQLCLFGLSWLPVLYCTCDIHVHFVSYGYIIVCNAIQVLHSCGYYTHALASRGLHNTVL